jgi:hypothetical protein
MRTVFISGTFPTVVPAEYEVRNVTSNRTTYHNKLLMVMVSYKKEFTAPNTTVVFLGRRWTVVPRRAENIISCNNIRPRIRCATFTVQSRGYLVKIPDIFKKIKNKLHGVQYL